MANVIAVVWDFDKTLISGYMQDPMFRAYGVDAGEFWSHVNALPEKYMEEQKVRANEDTIYLNQFINEAQPGGRFEGLNNARLREFGKEQSFYNGVLNLIETTKASIASKPVYGEYGIKVEHYIVSTGFAEVIRGSEVYPLVDGIWGCELIEREVEGTKVIAEIGFTIDNTTKTRALFEINKGIPKHEELDVNVKMPENMRRAKFENMIYIADGPSDIPAFSVVKQFGGSTFAVYSCGDDEAFQQVERMREDGRIDMYAQADYSGRTTANMWISHRILECAERICREEKRKLESSVSSPPQHLT